MKFETSKLSKVCGAALLTFIFCCEDKSLGADPGDVGSPHFDVETRKRLETTFIDVRWDSVDIETVLKDVAAKCKSADHTSPQIALVLHLLPSSQKPPYAWQEIRRHVTMNVENTSVMDALGDLAPLTHCGYVIHKNQVIFMPMYAKVDPSVEAFFIGPVAK